MPIILSGRCRASDLYIIYIYATLCVMCIPEGRIIE